MKLLLLLLVVPLAMCTCPEMLEGIDKIMFEYPFSGPLELVDVACGRKTYTEEFWNRETTVKLMRYAARDAVMRNSTLCSPDCIDILDRKHHVRAFAPLAQSLRQTINTMDHAESKALLRDMYNHAYKYRLEELANDLSPNPDARKTYEGWYFYYPDPSTDSEIASMQAMKRAFGIEETAELRSERIAVAVEALRNAESPRDDAEIAAIIGKIRELWKDLSKTPSLFSLSFLKFAQWMKNDGNVWIRPVEVNPAIEILYIQSRQLKNEKAITFIDSFLNSTKAYYEKHESVAFWNGTKNRKRAFDSPSKDAVSALENAFPELFDYLYKNKLIVKRCPCNLEG